MSHLIYNAGIRLFAALLSLVWRTRSYRLFGMSRKTRRFIQGRRGLARLIREEMAGEQNVCWVHAASLGEYGVIRPVLREIRASGMRVVLTFFSPSGYEALKSNSSEYTFADHIFYLPIDTPHKARKFLDAVNPVCAVFAISEYWINYLTELRRRQIPTYLVSSLIPDDTYLKRWYARPMRKALRAVTTFMVLNENSRKNLHQVGFDNVVVTGDPLFDNAIAVAKSPYQNDIIERFKASDRVFIVGSLSDKNDMDLVSALANKHRDVKFMIVPHEISSAELNRIKRRLDGRTKFYSECLDDVRLDGVQVLIVDFMGALARIYRYADWAYVGGGFTPYLHSVIEATVYGLPVAFGPMIERKTTPRQLMELGIGQKVSTPEEFDAWFSALKDRADRLDDIRQRAMAYVGQNAGATRQIVDIITRRQQV